MAEIVSWPADSPLPEKVLAALKEKLLRGEVMVYPTSTLYGLGASIYSAEGVGKVSEIKQRPPGMPLSVMAGIDDIERLCLVPGDVRHLLDRGERRVTMVMPAREDAPQTVIHGGTIAVRLPCSTLTASIVECLGPVTATSANIHGAPTPASIPEVMKRFGDSVGFYIDSGTLSGRPTTLIDYTGESPKIIREGALSVEEARGIHEG